MDYGNGSDGALTVEAGQTVTIDSTKNYSRIYVAPGGILTASPWNGTSGGDIEIKCTGTVDIEGTIEDNAEGYRGGQGYTQYIRTNYGPGGGVRETFCNSAQGESYAGTPGYSTSANYSGGGGSVAAVAVGSWSGLRSAVSASGGSYSTSGQNGQQWGPYPAFTSYSYAGNISGDEYLSNFYMDWERAGYQQN